jgi:phosphoglycolate phosphatase
MDVPLCNICGSTSFKDRPYRPSAQCGGCGAMERTRIMKLILEQRGLPRKGDRVLHLAPEGRLSRWISEIAGNGYDPVDLKPEQYKHVNTRKLDLVTDAERLPSRHYDLIVHSHVMEHVPANLTAVLWYLHRALKDDGLHLCCIPVTPRSRYSEDLSPLSPEEATKRFGQSDHVRRFGAEDIGHTLGMVFRLPEHYDIAARFGAERLLSHGIKAHAWRGFTQHTVLELRKDDLKLI